MLGAGSVWIIQLHHRRASDLIKAKWQDGGTGCEMYATGRCRAQKSVYSVLICTKCNRQSLCWVVLFSVGGWRLEGNTEEGFQGVDNCFPSQVLVTCEEVIKLCVDVHFSLSILK